MGQILKPICKCNTEFKELLVGSGFNYLENNYVTIVPTQYDLTCHDSVEELKKWKL